MIPYHALARRGPSSPSTDWNEVLPLCTVMFLDAAENAKLLREQLLRHNPESLCNSCLQRDVAALFQLGNDAACMVSNAAGYLSALPHHRHLPKNESNLGKRKFPANDADDDEVEVLFSSTGADRDESDAFSRKGSNAAEPTYAVIRRRWSDSESTVFRPPRSAVENLPNTIPYLKEDSFPHHLFPARPTPCVTPLPRYDPSPPPDRSETTFIPPTQPPARVSLPSVVPSRTPDFLPVRLEANPLTRSYDSIYNPSSYSTAGGAVYGTTPCHFPRTNPSYPAGHFWPLDPSDTSFARGCPTVGSHLDRSRGEMPILSSYPQVPIPSVLTNAGSYHSDSPLPAVPPLVTCYTSPYQQDLSLGEDCCYPKKFRSLKEVKFADGTRPLRHGALSMPPRQNWESTKVASHLEATRDAYETECADEPNGTSCVDNDRSSIVGENGEQLK